MKLKGKRVAILLDDLFQDLEVYYPYLRFLEEGAEVVLVGRTGTGPVYKGKYGLSVTAHTTADKVVDDAFDALFIPGGWAPDKMRLDPNMLEITRKAMRENRLVMVNCHGGWVLASAEVLQGRHMTCYEAIIDDIKHAGATYEDAELVEDGNLLSSRKPMDLPALLRRAVQRLANA